MEAMDALDLGEIKAERIEESLKNYITKEEAKKLFLQLLEEKTEYTKRLIGVENKIMFKWEKLCFKEFKEIREQHGLQEINNCGLCNKKFEINSSVFFTPKKKVICKECYKKVSKQTDQVY